MEHDDDAASAAATGSSSRAQLQFPHSLGLLYSAFTYYCGFKVNSGEYKLMGLAPYGRPVYKDLITESPDRPPGRRQFLAGHAVLQLLPGADDDQRRFDALFGGPPRHPESDLEQRHMDLAASIQAVTEDVDAGAWAGRSSARRGCANLVLAGGVALNCVANGRLLREGPFEDIWIQPAAGDAGGALGSGPVRLAPAAREAQGRPRRTDRQKGSLLGPRFASDEIRERLDRRGRPVPRAYAGETELLQQVVSLLAEGKIVGWFQGRMEFGPRALGARSILGDPRSPKMQATMNLKIKFRESFRPFAPMVLEDEAPGWFGLEPGQESPYMLLVAPVLEKHRVPLTDEERTTMAGDPDLRPG